MGKKGSWFSAIKRVFIPTSKEKPVNGLENKSTKEKKKGRGILSRGETKSFIPLFRGPSSIEKILEEADRQKLLIRPHTHLEEPKHHLCFSQGLPLQKRLLHESLHRGLLLQELEASRSGERPQREAANSECHENDATLSAGSISNSVAQDPDSEAGLHEEWDDSVLPKEEIEARLQRKEEAIIKRARTMAYAYSQQLWKANPKSAQPVIMDIQSGGFPWWWNWLDRQLPPPNPPESQTAKSFHLTPLRQALEPKPSPLPAFNNYKQSTGFANLESLTPKSTRSAVPMRTNKPLHTPSSRTPTNSSVLMKKYSKPRPSAADSAFDVPLKDDDSLMSCPPFSFPNYMTPTVSTKGKVKGSSDPNEGFPGTPSGDSKGRFSFTLTPSFGSFKVEQRL
ncbi:hypothetical protein Acr_00g0099120 [Actinidia rufa]|uniref:Uncharacterized protein n=1 Tax=Actinidia rufa TaxID=165716 RepID=A0A7J0E1V5_9ERIC|nr:hypothetical protein Acr_00g0099120 [Actinidia rufa]